MGGGEIPVARQGDVVQCFQQFSSTVRMLLFPTFSCFVAVVICNVFSFYGHVSGVVSFELTTASLSKLSGLNKTCF